MLYNPNWTVPADRTCCKAADIIGQRGWCQDSFSGPSGEICLMQALIEASDDDDIAYGIAFRKVWHRTGGQPVIWNDKRGRTKEEVVDLLRSIT